jgi:hypothetical protein
MPLRPTMAALATQVRGLIDDLSAQVFSDDDLALALDRHATNHDQERLTSIATRHSDFIEYRRYKARSVDWEDEATLYDANYNVIALGEYEQISPRGLFVFPGSAPGPMFVSGSTYDVYAVAVDLLEQWLAKLKLQYSFSTDGTGVSAHRSNLSEKYSQVAGLITLYSGKMKVVSVPNVRDDLDGCDA